MTYALAVAAALAAAASGLAIVFARRLRRVERRLQVLDEVARVGESGSSLEETLDAIAGVIVPTLGDFCAIDMIEEGGVRRAAARTSGPDAAETRARLAARRPSLQALLAGAAAEERQEPVLYEAADDEDLRRFAQDEDDLQLLRSMRVRFGVMVELRVRGKPLGTLTYGVGRSGRRLGREDVRFAGLLAGRVALALGNAGLFSVLERSERAQAEIAQTLQRGLLPPPLPHIPGWTVAATYRPAGAENEIGGDFYDAFRIASGWMVVVGDVTGRGAQAAAVTAHARYTLRTAAALTGDPVIALRTLNRELLARGGAALCSVAAMTIPEDGSEPVRLAVAGHPPPLLVDADSVREAGSSAPLLGAFPEDGWHVDPVTVEPRQQLVVVTDGVTEAVGSGGRFGEERLRAALAGIHSPSRAAQRIEAALHEFTGGELEDDAAIVAVARTPAEGEPAPEADRALVERLYAAFNRREADEIVALCDERIEFFPVGTAEEIGRTAPYVGPEGLQEYLRDVERAWDELLIMPKVVEQRGASLLVRGRVYARSRQLGIRDVPVAWIWEVAEGRFRRGEVLPDPDEAIRRLG